MKLFYLGLMGIALILVLLSISVNTKEGFDFEGRKDEQRKYLKDTDKYWDSRLFPQVVKGVDKERDSGLPMTRLNYVKLRKLKV